MTAAMSTLVAFHGDDEGQLKDLLYFHSDVVHEIWRYVGGMHDTRIRVDVSPPDGRQHLEWTIEIRSPKGVQTLAARQARPTSPIHIVRP